MRVSVINNRFERVIQQSFVGPLLSRGYQRKGHQFYLKAGRVGKLLTIQRDVDHTHYRQVAIFTINVHITSDDFWALNHPDRVPPVFPFQGYDQYVLHRHLGLFYGKQRGTQWLALDATVPEQAMITYLRDLLSTRLLPYLDRINSIDDILTEFKNPSVTRMRMFAWLGRRNEAYAELRRLIASRHQKTFRINVVGLARHMGII